MLRLDRSQMGIFGHGNTSVCEPTPYLSVKRRRSRRRLIVSRSVGNFIVGGMLFTTMALICNVRLVACFSFQPIRTVTWTRYTSQIASPHFVRAVPRFSSLNDESKVSQDDEYELNGSATDAVGNDGNAPRSNFLLNTDESVLKSKDEMNDGNEEYLDDGKFQIATGISIGNSVPGLPAEDNMSNGVRDQIQQQQLQIDMLIEMMKNQTAVKPIVDADENMKSSPLSSIDSDTNSYLPPPLPGMFTDEGEDEISDYSNLPPSKSKLSDNSSKELLPKSTATSLTPLKAMIFIDGTWLYYSLHRRKEQEDPIVKKFGKGWQHRYRFDWDALPRIICEQLAGQESNMSWTSTGMPQTTDTKDNPPINTQRPIEIVRASVFTSYKKTTDPNSFRVKMFNEMADANYDVHMLESFGNGPEKCVDISLAVEMLHYATVPNAYDVAILLSGDKDFLPALVRTRQKGRKVGVVSMHTGCNRALYVSPHVKDYDVVWIDDALDELIVPLPPGEVGKRVESIYGRGLLSAFTITKVLLTFINQSPTGKVSSRDVGRYLKGLEIQDGTTLLDDLKVGRGGLRRFLQERMPLAFTVTDPSQVELYNRDSKDKSYWISTTEKAAEFLLREGQSPSFSTEEKQFLEDYESGKVGGDIDQNTYYHTNGRVGNPNPPKPIHNKAKVIKLDALHPSLTEDYTTFTVARLKERCRERGIPVTGTKAILLGRVQEDVRNQISELKAKVNQIVDARRSDTALPTPGVKGALPKSNVDPKVTMHIEKLIKYYISQTGGAVSSRDLGRYLAANNARFPGLFAKKVTALQELKDNFGTLASFFDYKNDIFHISQTPDSSDYSFTIELSESQSLEKQDHQSGALHLESLVKEYIAASGGNAMSRNLGRYLAANAAWESTDQTALQQLKNEYGSLANFLQEREEMFTLIKDSTHKDNSLPPSTYNFGVTIKTPN